MVKADVPVWNGVASSLSLEPLFHRALALGAPDDVAIVAVVAGRHDARAARRPVTRSTRALSERAYRNVVERRVRESSFLA